MNAKRVQAIPWQINWGMDGKKNSRYKETVDAMGGHQKLFQNTSGNTSLCG
jgi:hypothetical protein